MKRIIHVVPNNSTPSGGMKVHFLLSDLQRSLGIESCVAVPEDFKPITWRKPPEKMMTYSEAKAVCEKNTIVIGWEDPTVLQDFPSEIKVCYIQSDYYFQKSTSYDGFTLWFNSNWTKKQANRDGFVVYPFLEEPFSSSQEEIESRIKLFPRNPKEWRILVQKRKHGQSRWLQVAQYLNFTPHVTFLEDVSEKTFADNLLAHHIVFASSYPEGLGLVPLEAMSLGTLAIGFTGGGGTEYMKHRVNSLFVPDGDVRRAGFAFGGFAYDALSNTSEVFQQQFVAPLLRDGYFTSLKYNKDATQKQMEDALNTLWRKYEGS